MYLQQRIVSIHLLREKFAAGQNHPYSPLVGGATVRPAGGWESCVLRLFHSGARRKHVALSPVHEAEETGECAHGGSREGA